MKLLEKLVLYCLRSQVQHAQDQLQFIYRESIGVVDAVLYLLHQTHSYLEEGSCAVRILFLFYFSSSFNTIQPALLRKKTFTMQVDPLFISWITDYLTDRPQFVRIDNTIVPSAVWELHRGPCCPSFYTANFQYQSGVCHMQKVLDDIAVVVCIKENEEGEYNWCVTLWDSARRTRCSWTLPNQRRLCWTSGASHSPHFLSA